MADLKGPPHMWLQWCHRVTHAARDPAPPNPDRSRHRVPLPERSPASRLPSIPAPPIVRDSDVAKTEAAVLRPAPRARRRLRCADLLQAGHPAASAGAGVRRDDDVPVLRLFASAQPADRSGVLRGWNLG